MAVYIAPTVRTFSAFTPRNISFACDVLAGLERDHRDVDRHRAGHPERRRVGVGRQRVQPGPFLDQHLHRGAPRARSAEPGEGRDREQTERSRLLDRLTGGVNDREPARGPPDDVHRLTDQLLQIGVLARLVSEPTENVAGE